MTYSQFTLEHGTFQNRSYSNVNGRIHVTVPNQSVPLGSVPRRRGGPHRYGTVRLNSVNSSVPLANSSTIILSELIGIGDTIPSHSASIPSHSTSSHHIHDCEMLQDSRNTLAVNRCTKSVVKSSRIRTFLLVTQRLSRAIRLFADWSVRWRCRERCKVETARNHCLIERTPTTVNYVLWIEPIEWVCFHWKRRVFAMCMIIHEKWNARDQFAFDSANGSRNRSRTVSWKPFQNDGLLAYNACSRCKVHVRSTHINTEEGSERSKCLDENVCSCPS